MKPPNYPVVQVAYFVADIREAARNMHQTFGAGPFFVVEDIQLASATHRGEECLFVHSSAYGQWGDLMIELVQQESEGPSPFRDLYPPGHSGLHHLATIVPDQQQAYAAYRSAGFEVATIATTIDGTEFAFVDALKQMGHFIEVYASSPSLLGFYDMVKRASVNWRGKDILRQV